MLLHEVVTLWSAGEGKVGLCTLPCVVQPGLPGVSDMRVVLSGAGLAQIHKQNEGQSMDTACTVTPILSSG